MMEQNWKKKLLTGFTLSLKMFEITKAQRSANKDGFFRTSDILKIS